MMRVSACLLSLLALALVACGDGAGDAPSSPTPLLSRLTPGPSATPVPTLDGPVEEGVGPIYWRTAVDLQTLTAGETVKVLFRVTGYEGETVDITARCETCAAPSQRGELQFTAQRAEPVGEEAPGSYYPFELTLPHRGGWSLTVVAGEAAETIVVSVIHDAGSAG